MIGDHLPALQIVLPLASAPFCVFLRSRRGAYVVAAGAVGFAFVTALILLSRVAGGGAISYDMGSWAPPWGIEYRIDALNAVMLVFISGIAAAVLAFAPASLNAEVPRERTHLFLALYLLCMTGMLGICITGDLFNVFVFLEIASLSSYAMVSLGPDRRALTAAFRYLVMGTIGATFILIGIGLLYMATGTLNMADMARLLAGAPANRTVLVAFAFFTVGACLKMALFPMHLWLPDAYTHAPSVVSAFLSGTGTKVAVYVLLRFVFTVFGPNFAFQKMPFGAVLMPAALAAILITSTVAILQTDVKRMLAYSSLAQIGYIVLGISFDSVTGLTGGIVHLFNHALMKSALFMAVGGVALRQGSVAIEDLSGLGRRMPWTMAAFTIGGLGLVGVPLTVGFVSKWYLMRAAIEVGSWTAAAVVLAGSLLALVYVWRVVEVAYFRERPEGAPPVREAPASMLAPTWTLIAATVVFGVWAAGSAGVARTAAEQLLADRGAPAPWTLPETGYGARR